jgi:hypothetical protein
MARFAYSDEDTKSGEKLDQDYDTPFSEPHDKRGRLAYDHPSTDSGLDEHELYDAGLADAAEVYERDEEEIK